MTSVFLPLPELKATATPSVVNGTAASGEAAGEASGAFARILDTVLAETDAQAQNLPDLQGFAYIAATLAPSPETNAPLRVETQTLTWAPVHPAAALPSEAATLTPALTTNAPSAIPLPSGQATANLPTLNLPETLALPDTQPATQPAQATKAPVTDTPQAPATEPDLATTTASVAAPTNTLAQTPSVQTLAQPQTLAQILGQTNTAPDAPATTANAPSQPVAATVTPQTPQASVNAPATPPVQTQPLASAAPVVQAAVSQTQPPQTKVPVDAPVQAQSVASPATSSETPEALALSPDAPHVQSATTQTDALPVSDKAAVTAPAPNMASLGSDLTDTVPNPVSVASAFAAAPESVTTAVQAALTPTARTQAPLASGPVTPTIDTPSETPEGEPLAPAATRAEAQAPADAKTPQSPLGSARSEPAPQTTVALKPEPAADAASAAIAKPDTAAAEATPPQSPTQTQIPTTPAAELAAARAPLQPALMTAAAPLAPAPQGSHLSSHAVENIAALSAQITRKLAGKTTQFDMQLKPADQGRVDVRLEINADGKLSAHLSFDSPVSESEFRGRQDELRRQLEQAGFQLEDGALSFSSRERQSRDGQHTPLPVDDRDIDIPAPLPVHNRPYAGAPVDGLYSSGQHLSLSMLV